jgi:hypothetical protein
LKGRRTSTAPLAAPTPTQPQRHWLWSRVVRGAPTAADDAAKNGAAAADGAPVASNGKPALRV